ncbi:MAG: glycosyltransferase family 1 protein [Balneolia bacterium]|nr:glycosyltransferase family 1 protein [Balneolia bacterium]
MARLRVAIFTGNYVHIKDGVSLTLNRLVRHLNSRDVETLVFGPGIKDKAIEPAGRFIEVPSVPPPGRPEYQVSLFLPEVHKLELEDFRPDIIHIATPDILGLIALNYARRHGIPVLSSYHTHFPSYLKYYNFGFLEPLLWKYLLWFYGHCKYVVSPSESMNAYLVRKGIPREKIGLWTRGIESDLFSPEKRDESYRAKLGFEKDDVVVSFISRLVWEKNLETFVKATDIARKKNAKVKVMVGGDGPVMDELKQLMPDAVFTGYQFGEDLAKVYAASDLFFFPSESETFGNVTLEAMSSGVPALVADAVGSKSLVIDGETGYILPPHDAEAFAVKILELAGDEEARRSMATNARKHALSYDWEAIMDGLINDYERVVALK